MDHNAVFEQAYQEGLHAGQKAIVTPMHIEGYAPVMDGVCGFAWVTVRPGNSSFANWLKRHGHARPGYGGGVSIWINEFNQSYTRKLAMARAMAEVMRGHGIKAYSDGRLD